MSLRYGPEWEVLRTDLAIGSLAFLRQVRSTPEGRPYYVNHATKTTTWDEPSRVFYPTVPVAQPMAHQPIVFAQPLIPQQPVIVAARPVVAPEQQHNISGVPTGNATTPAASKGSSFARTAALTKSLVVGKLAPSKLWKAGALTLDGTMRWVELKDGVLTIFTSKGGNVIFRAPMKFIQIVGDAATRETVSPFGVVPFVDTPKQACIHRGRQFAANEIAIYVEAELMNQEVEAQSSVGMGCGWTPGHLRPGQTAPETGLTGDVKQQNFSLFAADAADKQSWCDASAL